MTFFSRVLLLTVFVGAAGCSGSIEGTDDPAGVVGEHDDNATDFGATNWGEDNDDESIDPGVEGGAPGTGDEGATAEREAEAAGAGCARPKKYRLVHLQASMEHFDSPTEMKRSIDVAFAAGADTISWTEIETATQVHHIAGRAGWTTFWPSGRPEVVAKNAVPISFRNDTFKFVKGHSYFASEGLHDVSPSRWVTRVWLTHRASGKELSRVAHHSVSGVDGAGKQPVEWRRKMHAKDIAKFKEVMNLDNISVIGSADFNTTRLRTLLGSSFRYDVPENGGSHGARLIDWIVRKPHPDHKFVGVHFVDLGPSDHNGVRAAYDFTPCD